jgi:cell division septation protein DedD
MKLIGIQLILILLALGLPIGAGAQEKQRSKGDEYTIQIAAMMSERDARRVLTMKRMQGMRDITLRREKTDAGMMHRVQIGRYATKAKAEQAARALKERGWITDYFITVIKKTYIEESADLSQWAPDDDNVVAIEQPRAVATPAPFSAPAPEAAAPPVLSTAMPAAATETPASTGPRPEAVPIPSEDVFRLAAKSLNAAVVMTSTMSAVRNNDYGYLYLRPRDWAARDVGSSVLREEGSRSGEMFISSEAGAFISTSYRRFELTPNGVLDGTVPVKDITPENLIERIMGKLRKLPGVSDVRDLRYSVRSMEGTERTEVTLELKFSPSVDDAPVPFIGRAVMMRNAAGVLELIGLRQNPGTANVDEIIDQTLSSIKLTR